MDWLWQLLIFGFGLYVAYLVVVAVVIPAVVFVSIIGLAVVVPTVILGVLLMRETPQSSPINRSEHFLKLFVAVATLVGVYLLASEYAADARGIRTPSLMWAYATGVYATAGLYALYLTGHFAMRTLHYYRLPKYDERHQDARGRIDVERVAADAPHIADQAKRRSWVSQNQAQRAAHALSQLNGQHDFSGRPGFIDERPSRISAAREFIRAYDGYMRGATDTFYRQYEEDYEYHKAQYLNQQATKS